MTAVASPVPASSRAQPARVEAGSRFTVDGDPALERHLAETCRRLAAGIRGLLPDGRLEGILLGGGYGRGEGGVLRTPDGDRPYNDLECYVFVRGNRHWNERRFGRPLHVLGEILTPQAGIDVEFRITSRPELEAAPVSMFSYDLVSGHRRLVGAPTLLAGCGHHRDASRIPLTEATRLLMNRCSGLLFAAERLRRPIFTPADADFTARNIAKAQLGAGDAVLAALGRYHWSARERERRLAALPNPDDVPRWTELVRQHRDGVAFKLHPARSAADRTLLRASHAAVSDLCRDIWLWLEARRLGLRFGSVAEYATGGAAKAPDTARWRNRLVQAKHFGIATAFGADGRRHPRERVLNTLPLLLWADDALTSPALRRHVQSELHTPAGDFAGAVAAYREIWSRVN